MGTLTYAVVALAALFHQITAEEECLLRVKQGMVQGIKKTSAYNKTYCAYFGMPFAIPPVGERRFKLAKPAERWNGTYNATIEKSACCHVSLGTMVFTGEEDCLYLNVYTNQLRKGNEERNATLVSIHGGAFISGSASTEKYGPDFFLNSDVILVTIQYRLGILGFLALPEAGIPGNNGLKDQSLALRWVHENIEYFGGDPQNVTLVGESAGGASAHYHLLANMSKEYFQRIIIQSGSALSSWAYKPQEQLKKTAIGTANTCGCDDISTSEGILQCFKTESPDFLVPIGLMGGYYPTAEEESVEGDEAFITESPHVLCHSGKFQDKAVLLGTNTHEATLFMALIPLDEEDPFESAWQRKAVSLVEQNHLNEHQIKQCIKETYLKNNTNPEDAAEQLMTDLMFLIEQDATAKICANHSSKAVYYYYFQYDGMLALTKIIGLSIKKVTLAELGRHIAADIENITQDMFERVWREWDHRLYVCLITSGAHIEYILGPTHADENGFLFHMSNTPSVSDSEDWIMSRRLVTLWTNFAKYGVPFLRDDPDGVSVDWTPFTTENQVYLDINRNLTMKKDLQKERLEAWERCQK